MSPLALPPGEPIVGIDLGTTNSEVAVVGADGQPHVMEDPDGDPILPSFVGLSEDGRLLVGKAARNQWVLAPERMEVVEVVSDSDRPSGEVVGEVRRGYLWRGCVFRYAQVRVAKS